MAYDFDERAFEKSSSSTGIQARRCLEGGHGITSWKGGGEGYVLSMVRRADV